MADDIRICGECRHIRLKTILPKLKRLAPGADIRVGCWSYCGPCKRYAFICVNGRYVKGATENEVIEKAKAHIQHPAAGG